MQYCAITMNFEANFLSLWMAFYSKLIEYFPFYCVRVVCIEKKAKPNKHIKKRFRLNPVLMRVE